jgi:hypothetical protein
MDDKINFSYDCYKSIVSENEQLKEAVEQLKK